MSRKGGTEEVGWYTLTTFTSMASCGDHLIMCIGSLWYVRVDGKSSEKFVVERGEAGLGPLATCVPAGDGSTVPAIRGVRFGSIIST